MTTAQRVVLAIRQAVGGQPLAVDDPTLVRAVEQVLGASFEQALTTLVKDEGIEDYLYRVRDSAAGEANYHGDSWHHPRVIAYSEAVGVLRHLFNERTNPTHG